jgi:hypothetical protein
MIASARIGELMPQSTERTESADPSTSQDPSAIAGVAGQQLSPDATAAPPAKSLSSGLRNETVVVALNALLLVYSLPLFLLAWYLVTLKGPFVSSDPIPAAIINLSKDGVDVLGQLQKIILPTVMFIAGVMAVSRAERAQRLMSLAVVSLILLIGLAAYFFFMQIKGQFEGDQDTLDTVIGFFTRMFESLFSYFTLLLGVDLAVHMGARESGPHESTETHIIRQPSP